MASPDPAASGPQVSPTSVPTTGGSTGQHKQNSPPIPPTPPEKPAKPAPEIPKSRPILPEQLGLKCLYPVAGSDGAGKIDVDVIAVHGIGADPDWTWTAQETKTRTEVQDVGGVRETREIKEVKRINWLEAPDMLPKAIPKARIMRFGYDSQWFGDNAVKQRLPTIAESLLRALKTERRKCPHRPIVFIGHCFGGLVIQKALNLAKVHEHRWMGIFTSTTGIVFMGTPHHGTGSITSKGLMYSAIASSQDVQDSVLRALSAGDDILVDVLSEFTSLCNAPTVCLQLCCFFEQRVTSVGRIVGDATMREFVVDELSGSLEGYLRLGLPLDHFMLNKFLKPQDGNFKMVRDVIEDMVEASIDMMKSRQQQHKSAEHKSAESATLPIAHSRVSFRPLSRPPFLRDPKFVTREDIMQRVDQKFGTQRRVALYGNSGNGKTHIAVEYAHNYNEKHPGAKVLWVNARTADQFEHSFKYIGSKLSIHGMKDPKTNVLSVINRYLSQESHGQWLMVLDGADDQDTLFKNRAHSSKQEGTDKQRRKTLMDYVPTSRLGSVLITSRSLSLACELVKQVDDAIEVPVLTTEDAVSLLRKTLSENACDDQGALELVEALHRSPIAISQATAYILARGTEVTIPDYLASLKSQTLQLSSKQSGNATNQSEVQKAESAAVWTWQISYEYIKQKFPESAHLLAVISILDFQNIPMFLLFKWSEDIRQVKTALSILVQFAIVTISANEKFVSANRLVQLSTQAWLAQRDEKVWASERALWLLSSVFPSAEHEVYETCDILSPYAKVVLGFQTSSITSKLHRATLLFNIAAYEKHLGKYNDARRSLHEALKLREEGLDKNDEQIQETKKSLDAVREVQRQTEAGVLPTKEGETPGSGKQETPSPSALVGASKWPKALNKVQNFLHLAQQSIDQEQHQEAETMSKKGLAECEKTLGQDHVDTLQMADCLAITYQNQGRQTKALASHKRVLDWCKNKYGPDHLDTLRQTYNLALTYDLQGRYEKATPLYLQALEGTKKLLGADSPEALRILCGLATVYDLEGRHAEAEATFREALQGQQKRLGDDHPETLLTIHNLAIVAQGRNDLNTAEKQLLQVLEGQERVLGPEHSATLRTASNLALNFQLKHQYEQAEPLYQLALKGQLKRLGEDHPDTLFTRHMLGEFYEEQGRAGEAEVQYKQALEGRERRLGTRHHDTLLTKRKLENLAQAGAQVY